MIEPHLWAVGSHLWQALKMRAPSNGTGKLIGIFLRSRDWTENIALVADTVMDMTASTVNRELFIPLQEQLGEPLFIFSYTAMVVGCWTKWTFFRLMIRDCTLLYHCFNQKRYCKKTQCQPSNPSPDIFSITFKTVAFAAVFHRHKCVPGPQWQLRSTVSQQQSDSFIDYRRTRTFFWMRLQRFVFSGFYWFDNIAGYPTQYYSYYCNILVLLLHVVTRITLYLYLQLLHAPFSESATESKQICGMMLCLCTCPWSLPASLVIHSLSVLGLVVAQVYRLIPACIASFLHTCLGIGDPESSWPASFVCISWK